MKVARFTRDGDLDGFGQRPMASEEFWRRLARDRRVSAVLRVRHASKGRAEVKPDVAREELLEVLVIGRVDVSDARLGNEQHVVAGQLDVVTLLLTAGIRIVIRQKCLLLVIRLT